MVTRSGLWARDKPTNQEFFQKICIFKVVEAFVGTQYNIQKKIAVYNNSIVCSMAIEVTFML